MQFDDFAEAQNSWVALGMFILVDHDLDLIVILVEMMVKMTEMMILKLVKMVKLIEMLAFDNHISIRVLHISDQEPKDPRSLGCPVLYRLYNVYQI